MVKKSERLQVEVFTCSKLQSNCKNKYTRLVIQELKLISKEIFKHEIYSFYILMKLLFFFLFL